MLCLQMAESDVCLCSQDKDDVLSSVLGEASVAASPMSKSFFCSVKVSSQE